MRVAVASDKDTVSAHFGHCTHFNIYTFEDKQLVNTEKLPNPGHKPGYLPVFLKEQSVNIIISQGMGSQAVEIFCDLGIEAVIGATGDSQQAAHDYINGNLSSTGTACADHH